MNCYIITNPAYEDIICPFITGKALTKNKHGNSLLSKTQILIDNRQSYNRNKFKTAFNNHSGQDTVFIVPELNWDGDPSVNTGYEIALDLLNGKLKDNPFFNLVFISQWTREQLKERLRDEDRVDLVELVKSFPHVQLSCLDEMTTDDIPIKAYSEIHFELLKRVVASKSGRLDLIKHQLSYLKDTSDICYARKEMNQILELLSCSSFACANGSMPTELEALQNSFSHADTPQDIHALVDKIFQYVNDLMAQIGGNAIGSKKYPYSVLIIEDNPLARQNLQEFFAQCFDTVRAYSNEEILHADKTIENEAGKYNLIIFDMMYTASGRNDDNLIPFNGFDLIASLRKKEVKLRKDAEKKKDVMLFPRKAAVRIVTALPRNDLSRLVNKSFKIESPSIFTKGNGWAQLKVCLVDRMDEIIAECRKHDTDYRRDIYYPKNGIFDQPGMKEKLDENKAALEAAFEFANKVFYDNGTENEVLLTSKDTLVSKDENDPDELIRHLNATMAHRKLVIEYLQSTKDCLFEENKYRQFILDYMTSTTANQNSKKSSRRYDDQYIITQLGFSVETPERLNLEEEDKSNYVRVINLEERKNFFKQEFDAPPGEKPSITVQNWLDFMVEELWHQVAIDKHGVGIETFSESGIMDFLDLEEVTVDSLRELLEKVYDYISNTDNTPDNRWYLYMIFQDNFNLKDTPHKWLTFRQQCPELTALSDKLIDYRFVY